MKLHSPPTTAVMATASAVLSELLVLMLLLPHEYISGDVLGAEDTVYIL